MPEYVEQRNGGYYVTGTRVSLDSVVYAWLQGESPEGIQDCYSSLTMEQILGSLTFYLANRPMVDEYLQEQKQLFNELREKSRKANPEIYARLAAARKALPTRSS